MVTQLTQGVEVSVAVYYQAAHSNPMQHEYVYAYRISILNLNLFSIQLLSRVWHIFDSNGTYKQVEGAGVVGVQPIIMPTDVYTYTSGCNLTTDMGTMQGIYTMLNMNNRKEFNVSIPMFDLIYPMKHN